MSKGLTDIGIFWLSVAAVFLTVPLGLALADKLTGGAVSKLVSSTVGAATKALEPSTVQPVPSTASGSMVEASYELTRIP